jgi:hypothetical protein
MASLTASPTTAPSPFEGEGRYYWRTHSNNKENAMGKTALTPFNANDTTNTTFTAFTNSGTEPVDVRGLLLSAKTADSLTLTITSLATSSNQLGPIYLAADGDLWMMPGDYTFTVPAAGTIQVTKGTSSTNVTCIGFFTGN